MQKGSVIESIENWVQTFGVAVSELLDRRAFWCPETDGLLARPTAIPPEGLRDYLMEGKEEYLTGQRYNRTGFGSRRWQGHLMKADFPA